MRTVMEPQMKIGEVDISKIEFDLRSRDEIPKLLMGLQHIYNTPDTKEEVFKILEKVVPAGVNTETGRPGMSAWKILVLGTLRLNCNWDYDKLQEMANNHKTIRDMLGHGITEAAYHYALQTLKDNVSLFTPEILDEISQIVVKAGHSLVSRTEEKLKAKCDSFVVETDVHFPTDINLLFDAIRKTVILLALACDATGISDWRQSKYILKKVQRLLRRIQQLKRSKSKNEKKQAEREEQILEAYKSYVELVESLLEKASRTLPHLHTGTGSIIVVASVLQIENFIKHAERQIDQIKRRVVAGEKIPQNEKVYSIFELHTEWISKGKAGVPQELGVRVCVVEDQYGFILNHKVMEKETDDKVAVPIIEETKKKFPNLFLCSFDKGFHSPANKENLGELLDKVILPKKGKLSKADKEVEYSEEFIEYRHKHSAVESGINALEQHGLDRCLDHGIKGFKRYVALAVLARNLQIVGNIVQQKKLKSQKIKEKLRQQKEYSVLQKAA